VLRLQQNKKPTDLKELKEMTRNAVRSVTAETMQSIRRELDYGLVMCLATCGTNIAITKQYL